MQNFCLGYALYVEDIRIVLRNNSGHELYIRTRWTTKVHFFRTIILLLKYLSFLVFAFNGSTVGFDMSRLFAVVARLSIVGLTLVPRHVRPARVTSSTMLQSVTHGHLYFVRYRIYWPISTNIFFWASSNIMERTISEYFMAAADALHTVVMKVS
jgi:hypothetical protein